MKELRQEYWSRVKKGETSARKEKWESGFSGRRTDSVQKEIPVVLTTGLILVMEHNHPLLLQNRRHRLTDGSLANMEFERKCSGLKRQQAVNKNLRGTCTQPSCDFWLPPVCLNHKYEIGCKYGDKCEFLHTEAVGQPGEKSKKGGAKGSVA